MLRGLFGAATLLLYCWDALALQQCTTNQYICEDALNSTTCYTLRQSYNSMCTQMDDIAKQCLRTCAMCCHDTRYNCEDHPASALLCGTFKQFGMCAKTHSYFEDVARRCPRTCGVCDYNGRNGCQDSESLTYCRNMQKFCYDNSDLGYLVNSRCRWSCGCHSTATNSTNVSY